MARLILVLLLAFSLQPSSAEASARVPERERAELGEADTSYGTELLRSGGGAELLQGVEQQNGARSGRGERLDREPLHLPAALEGPGLFAEHISILADRGAITVDDVVAPLCEHLPYFATAPPAQR